MFGPTAALLLIGITVNSTTWKLAHGFFFRFNTDYFIESAILKFSESVILDIVGKPLVSRG